MLTASLYLGVLWMDGGFQWLIDLGNPPPWVQTALAIWLGLFVLYAIAVLVLTVSLAVVQLVQGSSRLVIAGLCALVVGAVCLPVAPVSRIGFLGLAAYMGAVSVHGMRTERLHGLTVWLGIGTAALLAGVALMGLDGWGLVFPALALYAAWAISIGLVELRRRPVGRAAPAPSQTVLQTGPGDR